jgi:hypothetical protein
MMGYTIPIIEPRSLNNKPRHKPATQEMAQIRACHRLQHPAAPLTLPDLLLEATQATGAGMVLLEVALKILTTTRQKRILNYHRQSFEDLSYSN